MNTGEKVIKGLGLLKFQYIYIQKMIDVPINIFIITVDSRFPGVIIPYNRLKSLKSASLSKMKVFSDVIIQKKPKLTPPVDLKIFGGDIPTNSVILFRDLAGEHYMNKNLYKEESKKTKIYNLEG